MRIAIVSDHLAVYGGAERVLQSLIKSFPSADIFTTFYNISDDEMKKIGIKEIKTTKIQEVSWMKKFHRVFLPLFAKYIEDIDLSGYDIVISSSHAVAKGVITSPDQIHICYCHSPMRYIWDQKDQYSLGRGIKGMLAGMASHYLRIWDVISSNRVDIFIANSNYISRRIRKTYNRNSLVVYPPVYTKNFAASNERKKYYMISSRLVEYKKVDLIISAFNEMPDRELVVIGRGPQLENLRNNASKNVQLLGYQSDEVLQRHMGECYAFVFAGEEDFGISLVEAQVSGAPVIAFKEGGAAEIVIDGVSGVLFEDQSVESIKNAIYRFESISKNFNTHQIVENGLRFSEEAFIENIKSIVESAYQKKQKQIDWRN